MSLGFQSVVVRRAQELGRLPVDDRRGLHGGLDCLSKDAGRMLRVLSSEVLLPFPITERFLCQRRVAAQVADKDVHNLCRELLRNPAPQAEDHEERGASDASVLVVIVQRLGCGFAQVADQHLCRFGSGN